MKQYFFCKILSKYVQIMNHDFRFELINWLPSDDDLDKTKKYS